ncbi:MAG: hypothetical protein ACREEM_55160, partial [Blastocatellia bacterium]
LSNSELLKRLQNEPPSVIAREITRTLFNLEHMSDRQLRRELTQAQKPGQKSQNFVGRQIKPQK